MLLFTLVLIKMQPIIIVGKSSGANEHLKIIKIALNYKWCGQPAHIGDSCCKKCIGPVWTGCLVTSC